MRGAPGVIIIAVALVEQRFYEVTGYDGPKGPGVWVVGGWLLWTWAKPAITGALASYRCVTNDRKPSGCQPRCQLAVVSPGDLGALYSYASI